MNITFSSNGKLRELLKEELILEVGEDQTLHDIIRLVGIRLDNRERRLLLEEDQSVQSNLLIVVNDEMVTNNETLKDGDKISVLMPMAGG